ncbi:hypothetical protein BD410DRAFT_399377 [Rickenella mellea]|uniref:F-box domain-containing protein n=1 Tax=Rickenella mellea TaxID=50990 RepID=A0A4Y7PFI0_9AGAM|nr:hypothetical protein BD410DRAFT_399377 [Rickenella mellea]
MQLGITDLPRLQHLTFTYPVELSSFSMPRLSHVEWWSWLGPLPWFLSKLTHIEFHLSGKFDELEDLVTALHSMKNLQDLYLKIKRCQLTFGDDVSLRSVHAVKPRSVHIDRLVVSIVGETYHYSVLLFDALTYLLPSKLELSTTSTGTYLFNSKNEFFPYGSTIKLHVPKVFDVMRTLVDILRSCDIVKTVDFDQAMGQFHHRRLENDDWERLRSLDHLRFMNCDEFTESEVEALVTVKYHNSAVIHGRFENAILD